MSEKLPHWSLDTIFTGLESSDYRAARASYESQLADLEKYFDTHSIRRAESPLETPTKQLVEQLSRVVAQSNRLLRDGETLQAFVYALITTDSFNAAAAKENSQLEMLGTRRQQLEVRLKGWLGSLAARLPEVIATRDDLKQHEFILTFLAEQSRYTMPEPMEALAAQLSLDAGMAFGRLQGNITSQLTAPWEEIDPITKEKKVEQKPITMIRNLVYSPDAAVRERAYRTEQTAWASVHTAVAACLNGVKGTAITLAKQRGRSSVLDVSLEQNRIDRQTLDALLGAIRQNFPTFRRYMKAKAARLGKTILPWWDLFAPLGHSDRHFSWQEARDFIVEKFSSFSKRLGDYASRTFAEQWIDAEPRRGKRGGAYCMPVPGREESRVLMNFDGSYEQLMTLAHELGHGFHNECQTGLEMLRRGSPMTLAETASIFCETLMCEATLKVASRDEKLLILDAQLAGSTQVCLDISSRYIFETAVMARREQGELSPEEFCDLMRAAQAETYGDAVDAATYHPYMWLMKPHYYSHDENFYNYPYAFGQLFGFGLYAIYRKIGPDFVPRYEQLLRDTGVDYAAALTARFGVDIRAQDFWCESLKVVERQVVQLETL